MINKLKKQQKIGCLWRKMVYDVTEKTCDHRDDFGCIDNTVGT